MKHFCRLLAGLMVASGLVAALPTFAVALTITFDKVGSIPRVWDGAGNQAVEDYMNNVLHTVNPAWSVDVTGAKGERDYTGDSHVVSRPVPPATSVRSETLGTTDGARWVNSALVNILTNPVTSHYNSNRDSFIVNSGSDRITMRFNFPIDSISFDYQIFPNGTCPKPSRCGPLAANWPTFAFEANDVQMLFQSGIAPGSSGVPWRSPASNPERAPQYLGFSGPILLGPNGAANALLEFIDWPVMIGIDNLTVTPNTPRPPQVNVPEPSSFVLLAPWLLALGAAVFLRRRRRA